MRTKVTSLTIIFLFLILSLRLFYLQIIKTNVFKELSSKNRIRLLPQEGSRGIIFDRKGNIIAGSQLCYDVMVMPESANQTDKLLTKVSEILGITFTDLKKAFKKNYTGQSLPVSVAENIDIKKAMALEELKADFSGLVIQPKPQRLYPYGRLACHVLGYLNEIDHWRLTKLADYGYKTKDIVGFGGVEEKYDYYLRQEEGGTSVEIDHQGRFVRVLGFKPPHNGKDIHLTLDLKIQKIVEEALYDRKGCVILMNPDNGQIIALASSPNFNPAVFIKKQNSGLNYLFNDPNAPLINRALSAVYPAGSVFKVVVACAALETGKLNLSKTFFCPGSMRIGRQEFSCWDRHDYQNLRGAITHSCNVFFYHTGLLIGAQTIYDYALKFGFAKITSIDLPYEAAGQVPSPLRRRIYRLKNWFEGDTANLAIGQGELLVSPLQLTRMMAVFANKGNLVTPYVLKAVAGRDISVEQNRITASSLKQSTIDYMRAALRNVVVDPLGTAHLLADLPVAIAGKTGTAQVSKGQPHGYFVGFFPFSRPQFVICVFLEHGGSGYNACVLAKRIIAMMLKKGLI
jgi:penicillin-binding protein 2